MKRTRFLLILDSIVFVSLVLLIEPRFAGLTVHEWLGLAFPALIVIHVACGWAWIVGTFAKLRTKGAWRSRINFLLNLLLFVALTVTAFSGALTSFVALPKLGIAPGNFENLRILHNRWSVYLQVLVGLHVALNWGWIVGAVRRHVLIRPTAQGDAALALLRQGQPES